MWRCLPVASAATRGSSVSECTVLMGGVDSEADEFTVNLLWKDVSRTLCIIEGQKAVI